MVRFNVPPLTRALLVLFVVATSLNTFIRYRKWSISPNASIQSREFYAPYLTLIPGTSIIYPWTFATATLVEQNIFGLSVTGLTLYYGGRYLERAWGSAEYIKFIILSSVLPNILCFMVYIGLFAVTRHASLVSTSICGGIALQGAFLVSFKQLVPEHTVTIAKGIISIRVKHFPAVFILANTASGLVFGTDTAMLLAWFGFLISWGYLRFYRNSPSIITASTTHEPTIRGDASDTFAFAYFFPEPLPQFITPFTDAIYRVLVLVGVCTAFSSHEVDAGNEQALARREAGLPNLLDDRSQVQSGKGKREEEAERRRALALKALDQRLQVSSSQSADTNKATDGPSQSVGNQN